MAEQHPCPREGCTWVAQGERGLAMHIDIRHGPEAIEAREPETPPTVSTRISPAVRPHDALAAQIARLEEQAQAIAARLFSLESLCAFQSDVTIPQLREQIEALEARLPMYRVGVLPPEARRPPWPFTPLQDREISEATRHLLTVLADV
jgi:hypothetical protein